MSSSDITDWDRIASAYSEGIGTSNRFYKEVEGLAWERLGDLSEKRVLDLGSGDGWFAHELVKFGAEVVAVDGSQELVEAGESRYPEVHFVQRDLTLGLPDLGHFDAVWSFMVLMDLPVLDAMLRDVYRALKPEAPFLITVLHPCFFNFPTEFDPVSRTGFRKIDRYLKQETWRIETFGGHNHYHRSITDYCESFRKAGFVISRLVEPQHIPAANDCDFYRDIPILLYFEVQKGDV